MQQSLQAALSYPALLRQPAWVIQSASADQPGPEQLSATPSAEALRSWARFEPGWQACQRGALAEADQLWREALQCHPNDVLLARALNRHAPELLRQRRPHRPQLGPGQRIAVVLPGELRCIAHSRRLFKRLNRHADLFVCTSASYAKAAAQLPGQLNVIDPEPQLPMGAMQQWHKLAVALAMVRAEEQRRGWRYSHILKLRTDFHHVRPKRLLDELLAADGLICASDKVFGGPRALMLLFEAFYPAITGWFDQREQHYWPINVQQILRSDDSVKWYGMAFPQELVGRPASVAALRQRLVDGGEALQQALLQWRPAPRARPDQLYWRLFQGHPRFASEVCFARFLNVNGVTARSSAGLLGFLRSDRQQA